jgi:hypothetical protein
MVVGSRTVRVSVAPVRCAYLVRAGDRAAILDAIRFASTEWGGVAHPIITVSARTLAPDRYAMYVAKTIRTDYLIDFTSDMTRGRTIAEELGASYSSSRSLETWQHGLHPLAVVGDDMRARTLFVPARSERLSEVAALGELHPDHLEEWAKTGARITPARLPIDLLDGQLDVPSPIWAGRRQLEVHQLEGFGSDTLLVYVGSMPVPRAVRFWNERAMIAPLPGLAPDIVWLPLPALRDDLVLARLRERCASSYTTPNLVLLTQGIGKPDIEWVTDKLGGAGFEESSGTRVSSNWGFGSRSERELADSPLTFRLNQHPLTWVRGDRRYGRSRQVEVAVTRPKTTLSFESPVHFDHRYNGFVKVAVTDLDELRWPERPEVGRLVDPNGTYAPEGWTARYMTTDHYRLTLALPEPAEVATAILAAHGWSWAVSDKGTYAHAVRQAAGDGLIALTADRLALEICRQMAGHSTRKAEQAAARIQAMGDADTVQILVSLMREPAGWYPLDQVAGTLRKRHRDLMPHVNGLIAAGLIRRAFRHICPVCTMPSAVPFDRASDIIACEGCGHRAAIVGPADDVPILLYSLNSLLARAIDQGAMEQLLMAEWAMRELGLVWAIAGAVVTHEDGTSREVDLLGVSHEALAVGEAKGSSRQMTDEGVRDAAALAQRLGADMLVLAADDDWASEAQAAAAGQVDSPNVVTADADRLRSPGGTAP